MNPLRVTRSTLYQTVCVEPADPTAAMWKHGRYSVNAHLFLKVARGYSDSMAEIVLMCPEAMMHRTPGGALASPKFAPYSQESARPVLTHDALDAFVELLDAAHADCAMRVQKQRMAGVAVLGMAFFGLAPEMLPAGIALLAPRKRVTRRRKQSTD